MKPVKQTLFGEKEGNCFAACVATVLEVELDEVPNFGESHWLEELREYCIGKHNLYPLVLHPVTHDGKEKVKYPGYYIASGPSGRGLEHAVVYYDGEMVHDPHPDNTGLEGVNELVVFMALNPAVVK